MDYRNILKTNIRTMISNDLTIGRRDNDVLAFTDEEIEKFLQDHDDKIERVITRMIDDYQRDNDIETLANPLLDWIGEYLYEEINTNIGVINHSCGRCLDIWKCSWCGNLWCDDVRMPFILESSTEPPESPKKLYLCSECKNTYVERNVCKGRHT